MKLKRETFQCINSLKSNVTLKTVRKTHNSNRTLKDNIALFSMLNYRSILFSCVCFRHLKMLFTRLRETSTLAWTSLKHTLTCKSQQFLLPSLRPNTVGGAAQQVRGVRYWYHPNADKRVQKCGTHRFLISEAGKQMFWRKLIKQGKVKDYGPYADWSRIKVKDKHDKYFVSYKRYRKNAGPKIFGC